MALTFREFFDQSEIHGIRWLFTRDIAKIRRCLWFIVFPMSMMAMGYLFVLRVLYFYDYPTSSDITVNNDHVKVPAVALCPRRPLNVMPPPASQLQHISDKDFVYLLSQINISLLSYDMNNTGAAVLNTQLLDLHNVIPNTAADVNGTLDSLQTNEMYKYREKHDDYERNIPLLMQRINDIARSLSANVTAEYPNFMRKYGVGKNDIEHCKIWIDSVHIDCSRYMRQVLTSNGVCFALDNINGSAIYFNGMREFKTNKLEMRFDERKLDVYIYDSSEFPDWLYETIRYIFTSTHGELYRLMNVHYHHALSVPYSKKPCVDQERSYCVRKCLPRLESPCIPYFLSDVQTAIGKPVCEPAYRPGISDHAYFECANRCVQSCNTTDYILLKLKEKSQNSFDILVDSRTTHEMVFQTKLYEVDALLAELGGIMGLFVGASILTLYSCIEYMCTRFIQLMLPSKSKL